MKTLSSPLAATGSALFLLTALIACSSDDTTSDTSQDMAGMDMAGDAPMDQAGDVGDTPATMYDLTFSGTAFLPHAGQTLKVVVLEQSGDAVAAEDQATVAADGSFSFTWPAVLKGGVAYEVTYYADLNGNGACDAPPTDHGWQKDIEAVSADVTLTVTHNTDFAADVCTHFP